MSQFTNALSYVDIDNLHQEDGKSNEFLAPVSNYVVVRFFLGLNSIFVCFKLVIK